MNIKEFKNGASVEGEYLLTACSIQPTRTGKLYMRCTLQDNTGTINCVNWNASTEIATGTVVHITGTVDSYNSSLQLNLSSITEGSLSATSFTVTHPDVLDIESYREMLASCTKQITNETVILLIDYFSDHLLPKVITAPAAISVHHACAGGLVVHLFETLKFVLSAYNAAPTRTKVLMNKDVMIAGALYHDIGKLLTYTDVNVAVEMTDLGRYQEHIITGVVMLNSIADICSISRDDETLQQVAHIIAAHHMELEWGSPVNPCSLEAVYVAHADQLSASTDTITAALEGRTDAKWTSRIYSQHNRQFTSFTEGE